MKDISKMVGNRIEIRILQGAPFDITIMEVDDTEIKCNDDNGEVWQIKRDAVIMWREKPIKAKKTKVE